MLKMVSEITRRFIEIHSSISWSPVAAMKTPKKKKKAKKND
jgi:hypothetical protein